MSTNTASAASTPWVAVSATTAGDGLADVAHLVGRQQGAGDHRVERRGGRLQFEVGGGEHGDDAGHRAGLVDVDRQDRAVRRR